MSMTSRTLLRWTRSVSSRRPAWRALSTVDSLGDGDGAGMVGPSAAGPPSTSSSLLSDYAYFSSSSSGSGGAAYSPVGTPPSHPLLTLGEDCLGAAPTTASPMVANLSDESEGTVSPWSESALSAGAPDAAPPIELIPVPDVGGAATAGGGESAASAAAELLPELGYYPSHLVMQGIEGLHLTTGLPYWATIVVATIGLRSMMLPLAFKTMRNSARMAVLKPELQLVMDRMKQDPASSSDPKRQKMYQTQMNALFKKHDAYPMRSLQFPLLQLPVFMSFFFGLKTMGDYFPSISDGGALWFTDLSAADPFYIFPVVTAVSFLGMIEIGADGMQQSDQMAMFKNVMRGMAVVMIPMTYQMPCAVFCYWSTANSFSLFQTLLLKVPGAREYLDVPLPPPPPPTATTALPEKIDPSQSPIKAMLRSAKGESLEKTAIAASEKNFRFDEKKHEHVAVHAQKPKKREK